MGNDRHDFEYYKKCVLGGILACGFTHTGIVTMDLIKCKKQINPTIYKSMADGIRTIKMQEGTRGLFVGWLPTFIGYSLQGAGKYGFYEFFKDIFAKIAGPNAAEYKVVGYALSSACAEFIADCFLCPWEAVKVRMQTSAPGTFPTTFYPAFRQIMQNEGYNGFYKGLYALWARQIPYTIVKFVFFEKTVEFFYRNIFNKKPKDQYSKATQLSITFTSGYIAGILCAIVSHPADTMVSKLNYMKSEGTALENAKKIYADIGFKGLWRGLGTRIIMIGTLTGFQWWIYDSFKTAVGLQTSGGFSKK